MKINCFEFLKNREKNNFPHIGYMIQWSCWGAQFFSDFDDLSLTLIKNLQINNFHWHGQAVWGCFSHSVLLRHTCLYNQDSEVGISRLLYSAGLRNSREFQAGAPLWFSWVILRSWCSAGQNLTPSIRSTSLAVRYKVTYPRCLCSNQGLSAPFQFASLT